MANPNHGNTMQKTTLLSLVVLGFMLAGLANAYSTQIYDPAVVSATSGQLTNIRLNVTSGNGSVTVSGPSSVAQDTLQSAETGAAYAANYLGVNESAYNFSYYINDNNSPVSGPSAGLSFTILAISGLEHKPIIQNLAATGTISSNGTAGLIGGIFDKAAAAKAAGKSFLIVPYAPNSSIESMFYYAAQQNLGIGLVEVKNASEALPYAFGTKAPQRMSFNYSQNYSVSTLPNANQTCNACNISYFYPLENMTMNMTAAEINSIGSNFSSLKQQMLSVLSSYSAIGAKGYLYTASDLAFNEYIDAFTLASINNASLQNASATLAKVQDYCNSLSAPQLTTLNYEYVIGGEFRQTLANQTLNESISELNSSTSSDGLTHALRSVGTAYAWCKAASTMYNTAYTMGGTNVTYDSNIRNIAQSYLSNATSRSLPNTYLGVAAQAFKNGNYYVSIYGSVYSNIFGSNLVANRSSAQAAYTTATSNQYGIWAKEFDIQSAFFLNQANQTHNSSLQSSYFVSAYSAALLSSGLSNVNKQISSNFVNYTAVYPQGYAGIQDQLNQIFGMLTLIFIMLILIFIILLKNEIKGRSKQKEVQTKVQTPASPRRRQVSRKTR